MGLLAPAQVQDFLLLQPAPAVPYAPVDLPPPDGTTVAASARTIRIGDVIAAEGPRVPDVTAAPSAFRAAFVLLNASTIPRMARFVASALKSAKNLHPENWIVQSLNVPG